MQSVTGPGRVVAGRYELLDTIGHGAMGTVWRARDLRLAREVAVKEVHLPGPMTERDRAVLRERSLREARVAARLSHPGVVTVHDVIEAEGSPWIVMELVPARSLAQVLAEDGPMPPARAGEMGMTLLEALGSAHAAGVVHRDVKPGNVLVTPDGRAVLTDFGIATLHGDPGLTQAGMVMGTPGFCAPERIRGEPGSPASDLWSLGATLYAAVEGHGPFDGQGSAMAVLSNIVHGDPPPAACAGALGPVITALMSRDPAARPDAARARRLLAAACASASAPARQAAGDRRGARSPDATLALPTNLSEVEAAFPQPPPTGAAGAAAGPRAPAATPAARGKAPTQATTTARKAPATVGKATTAAPATVGKAPAEAAMAPEAAAASGPAESAASRRRQPGRHRRALLIGGGGATVVLAVLLVAAAILHARAQAIRRAGVASPVISTAASTPRMALPAGYHWYTEPASSSPRRAGFAVAVPDGWRTHERGGVTVVRNPVTGGSITLVRAPRGAARPLREAELLAGRARQGSIPGYRQIAVLPVPFHGTPAAAWRYISVRPGNGQVQTLELVARLDTPLGPQPYELAVTAPTASWLASRAVFGEVMLTFTPR